MNIDFTKPNYRAVEQIDFYFQYDDKLKNMWERQGAPTYYRRDYDGWSKQPDDVIRRAFYASLSFMADHDVTEEMIKNY